MMKRTRTMLTFVSILFLVFGLSACGPEEEKDSDAETAPTLPPESSMVMDFSNLSESATAKLDGKSLGLGNELLSHGLLTNYHYAAGHVLVWNVALWANMAIPVAALRESFNHLPTRQSDGTWVWSYTVTVVNEVYVASLHGKVSGSNVNWSMYVTKEGVYADYLWFSGVSALDGTNGTWALNYSIADATPTPLLDVSWQKDDTAGTLELRFTSKITNSGVSVGDYVEYAVTGGSPYDARYHISIADNLTEIEWNRTDKNGRVQDEGHYGALGWYCWDSLKADDVSTASCTP